jgi:hypothetical protein
MNDSDGMEVKKGNHAPRYCKTCEHYKPPRGMFHSLSALLRKGLMIAHHCRQCKTCIVSFCDYSFEVKLT